LAFFGAMTYGDLVTTTYFGSKTRDKWLRASGKEHECHSLHEAARVLSCGAIKKRTKNFW
jgi:hypothetical protein